MAVLVGDRVREAAHLSYFGDFFTPLGREWAPRLEASEAYHQRNSADWDYLRDLQVNVESLALNTWSTTVATGYALINNHVTETYFSNPESWVQAKSGDPDGSVTRAFRDIANTVHRDADTAGIMQRCLGDEGYAGFGGHWAYFEQIDEMVDGEVDDIDPITRQQIKVPGRVPKPVSQRICGDYVEPWDLRFDPDGRDWKLRDHKYIIRRYYKTLQQILDLPFLTDDGRRMLRAWAQTHRKEMRFSSDVGWRDLATTELDPGYAIIPMYEIWSRVSKQIIHIPVGANFHVAAYGWPRAWRYANAFPLTFVAFNREPSDRMKTRGFYPIPLLRLIHKQLENINRLEGLYMEAATVNVIKFLTIKGLLEEDEITKINNDLSRVVISIDITKIQERFPTAVNDFGQVDLRKLFMLMPMSERSGELFDYERAIEHELRMIARVIGSGSQDRFGLPESDSATEAAGLMDAMAKRQRFKSERAADKYDEITEKIFLILKTMQTLPIDYQSATDVDEGQWRQFTDLARVRTINLVFHHRIGTGVIRDPQSEAAARNGAAQMLLPIYQAAGEMAKVDEIAAWMLEPQNFRSLNVIRAQGYKQVAMELAEMIAMLAVNPAIASDPEFADRKADLASQLCSLLLSPAEKQQVAVNLQQKMTSGTAMSQGGSGAEVANPGTGSLPSGHSAGGQAYATATAMGQNGPAAAGRSNVAVN